MATIGEMCGRWQNMLESGRVFVESVEDTTDELLKVNQQQLLTGHGSDGQDLPVYKNFKMPDGRNYPDIKREMNPANRGRYDMHYTNESFENMQLGLDGLRIKIFTRGHAQMWDEKLDGAIFGIYENAPLMDYRRDYLFPMLVQKIKEATGAK